MYTTIEHTCNESGIVTNKSENIVMSITLVCAEVLEACEIWGFAELMSLAMRSFAYQIGTDGSAPPPLMMGSTMTPGQLREAPLQSLKSLQNQNHHPRGLLHQQGSGVSGTVHGHISQGMASAPMVTSASGAGMVYAAAGSPGGGGVNSVIGNGGGSGGISGFGRKGALSTSLLNRQSGGLS